MYIYAIYGLFTRVDQVGSREEDAQKVSILKNYISEFEERRRSD